MFNIAITGASGFLGQEILKQAEAEGYRTLALSRKHIETANWKSLNLGDREQLQEQLHGIDAVIHCAAKCDHEGHYDDFYRSNIEGTENLIQAAKACGVKSFIHTSSPSVLFKVGHHRNTPPHTHYTRHKSQYYPYTKAISEKIAMEAHTDDFQVIALRPHQIRGVGDHALPRILNSMRRLKRIGRHDFLVDGIHVEDAARAHILALKKLETKKLDRALALNVAEAKPRYFWESLGKTAEPLGIAMPESTLPFSLVYLYAAKLDKKRREGRSVEGLSRMMAVKLCFDRYFDSSLTREILGNFESEETPEKEEELLTWLRPLVSS